MAAEAAGNEASSRPRSWFAFLDLPAETQADIISHCSQSDLICVALVSKHFHELASAQLYRNFHIIFPDDDDLNFESPIDGLAGGLDTFTTSEYNYAKHVKDLSMDTLSAGAKAEQAYKSYLYSASCGKFLNTLLYLTLRKATSLEAFRWNIRVELSRPVYRELHKIPSLTRLHIRMQAGESYYNPPPPLPVSLDAFDGPVPASNHWIEVSSLAPGPGPVMSLPLTTNTPGYPIPNGPPPPRAPSKSKPWKRGSSSNEPPTLSGFKKLKTLSVLDIDNLDVVTELKICVKNSSTTLNELNLSLSDNLALQARKPPPDSDPDDSDVEDEFQVVPASQSTTFEASGPAKTLRAQEERKIQETVLGRIFDVEPSLIKKPQIKQESGTGNENGKEKEEDPIQDPREAYVSSIKGVSQKLMIILTGSRDISTTQQDILDMIEKASRKYVDSGDMSALAGDNAASSSNGPKTGLPHEHDHNGHHEDDVTPADKSLDDAGSSTTDTHVPTQSSIPLQRSLTKNAFHEATPEDIDIEHLETIGDDFEDSDVQEPQKAEDQKAKDQPTPDGPSPSSSTTPPKTTPAPSAVRPSGAKSLANLEAQMANVQVLAGRLALEQSQANAMFEMIEELRGSATHAEASQVRQAENALAALSKRMSEMRHQIRTAEAEVKNAEKLVHQALQESTVKSKRRYVSDYIRDTRGFSLEKLSIHLIPVKASVLSRAIDLRSLKQLTLLNVGNQAPIWTLLAKENKVRPLALRNVFTDNVSTAFLTCMSQLDELHELFMLERSAKYKPESFAPRSTTTIDQIRRLVLKKHMPTLKRLMIKDETNGPNWDANQKAMILVCTRGRQLEELAVSMNIHAVHAFMQYFSGLVNLRAINILHFRNNDTCIWVMREILRFIVDNLSHHPELKLEWIAMEDERVDRVIRPSEAEKVAEEEEDAKKDKGKGKAPAMLGSNAAFPILPVDGLDSESDSDDDDAFDNGKRLRLKTVGPLQFYDVWGVRIFEKEVRSGRL